MPEKPIIIPRDANGASYPAVRFGDVQVVAAGGTSAASNAVETQVVRLYATVDCHVVQGANPEATDQDTPLAAGAAEYVSHKPGWKFAVIKATGESDGSLYITEGR